MTSGAESARLTAQLPKLRYGFWIAGCFLVSEIVWGAQRALHPSSKSAGGYAAAASLVSSMVAAAFILSCIGTCHRMVAEVAVWTHPITPRRAVRFYFIPIFNFYWNFRWPIEIARFVNWRMQRSRMSGFLAGITVFIGAIVAAFFDGSIGLMIIFSGFAYISRCLRDAFAAPAVPPELYAISGLDAAMTAGT
jgi:hypothetical protein